MALTARPVTVAGGAPTYDATTHPAGDTIPGSVVATGRCFVRFQNPSAGAITVTIVDPTLTAAGLPTTDPTFEVAAAAAGVPGEQEVFIPLSLINPATSLVNLTYSAAGLTAAVRTV